MDAVLRTARQFPPRAAVAAGADGLQIEVHNDPAHALSDGPQSLNPDAFDKLNKKLLALHAFLKEGEATK